MASTSCMRLPRPSVLTNVSRHQSPKVLASLTPSSKGIRIEPLLFLNSIANRMTDVAASWPRARLRKEPSLAVAKAVVQAERQELESTESIEGWQVGLAERMAGLESAGGILGQAVQEGLAQAREEAQSSGQKVMAPEDFRALAVSTLEKAERALEAVQDGATIPAVPFPPSPAPRFLLPDDTPLFCMDDVLMAKRVIQALGPVITANIQYLRLLQGAAEAVRASAREPAQCHEQVLALHSRALEGGGPLKAALELSAQVDAAAPAKRGVKLLLTGAEYAEAMEAVAGTLVRQLECLVEAVPSETREIPLEERPHRDWTTWARLGGHQGLEADAEGQEGIDVSEMGVTYLPFSMQVPVLVTTSCTWEKDERGIPRTRFPQGLQNTQKTTQGVAVLDIPYAECHALDVEAISVVRFVPLAMDRWTALYTACSAASSDPSLLICPGFGMTAGEQIRMGALLKVGLHCSSTAPFVVLGWTCQGNSPQAWANANKDVAQYATNNLVAMLEALMTVALNGVNVLAHSLGGAYSTYALGGVEVPSTASTSALGTWVQAGSTAEAGSLQESITTFNDKRAAVEDAPLKCIRYICTSDRALLTAKVVDYFSSEPMDGEDPSASCGAFETVDCTEVGGADLLHHSYISRSRPVLYDLECALRGVESTFRRSVPEFTNMYRIVPK